MKVKELYVYPIKSLRGISVSSSKLTQYGLQYDRRFMLLKVLPDGKLENMHITNFSEMSLFQTLVDEASKEIIVKYHIPKTPVSPFHQDQTQSLVIPLHPELQRLETFEVEMHRSPTTAYKMPHEFNEWFSNCFGFPVIIACLGSFERQALGSISPNFSRKGSTGKGGSSWLSSVSSFLPLSSQVLGFSANEAAIPNGIAFSDFAPLLIANESSLATIHPRLRETDEGESHDLRDKDPVEKMDVKKFRPNIVLDGDPEAPWDEDFWGELEITPGRVPSCESKGCENENRSPVENGSTPPIRITLTGNCARCKSINIDYETGKAGTGPAGNALKKLMRDRRVDKGMKYSPVFGRYGFLRGEEGKVGFGQIRIGDDVVVSVRNEERTVFRQLTPSISSHEVHRVI